MKKIFKVTNWGNVDLTEENVLDKSHWFVKALDTALTAVDIGDYSIEYVGSDKVRLDVAGYRLSNPQLFRPQGDGCLDTSQPFIVYVDSEKKEILFCSQDGVAKDAVEMFSSTIPFNCARGVIYGKASSGTLARVSSNGGLLRFKFKDQPNISVTSTIGLYERGLPNSASYKQYAQVSSPFHENAAVLTTPVLGQSDTIRYHRLANVTYDHIGIRSWNGSFFESIFLCDKYYIGALASADNKKFIFNGLLFLVDDATDIGIIETTV